MNRNEPLLAPGPQCPATTEAAAPLPLNDALLVKSAEYWLMLGEPAHAMAELQLLTQSSRSDGRVLRVWVAVLGVLRARKAQTLRK